MTDKKLDLYHAMDHRTYDHAVVCSFTFDPLFFESHCLEKLRSFVRCKTISVLIDLGIYSEMLEGSASNWPKKANIRYLLHPIGVRGVFHPKCLLFASPRRGHLIFGSANLTRAGLTTNAETVSTFHYHEEKDESHLSLFREVFSYILKLSELHPEENLSSNLREMVREAPWLVDRDFEVENPPLMLHNLDLALWPQFIEGIETPVNEVTILSRYFDSEPALLDRIQADLQPEKIEIYTQNRFTSLTPKWLDHDLVRKGKAKIFLCNYLDREFSQLLHGKAIVVRHGKHSTIGYGSPNFTTTALLRTVRAGNAELMMRLQNVPSGVFVARTFVDPERSAIELVDGSVLVTGTSREQELVNERVHYKIELDGAELVESNSGNFISISATLPIDVGINDLKCKLTFRNHDTREFRLALDRELLVVHVPSELNKKLNDNSTVIRLECADVSGEEMRSNSVLIYNLRSPKTDRPLKRERHIKEAEESAFQFFAVLRDLLASQDDQALLAFLNFCDIPLTHLPRPAFSRHSRPAWDGGESMRQLGEKNLKIYTELHGAALSFFDKHLRKLEKHVKAMELEAIDNFLHIFLAMGDILRAQLERAIIGLESRTTPLTPGEWSTFRDHADVYLIRFRRLMECLWVEYLSRMAAIYRSQEIGERVLLDLESINNLCKDMLNYKARVETLRITRFGVNPLTFERMVPGYFHSVFADRLWDRYQAEIEERKSRVNGMVLAA